MKRTSLLLCLVLIVACNLSAQQAPPSAGQAPSVMRPKGIQAVRVPAPEGAILSFRSRGTTVVELRGTERMPNATVTLKVESRPGFVEIDINRGEIKNLEPASRFGRDFLTYVLWVVSVDGAASNIGEITFEAGQPISINVSTTYQTFWMMVTAEPDFAVHDPSPVVVLLSRSQENTATANKAHPVPGEYIYYTSFTDYDARPAGELPANVPSELLQARKAVELASESGILAQPTPTDEEPLPDELRTRATLQLARDFLARAESAFQNEGASQEAIQYSRTAAQIAENARALALGAVGGIYVRQLDRELEKLRAQYRQCGEELARLREEMVRLRDRYAQLEAALDGERRRTKELESQLLALRERIGLLEAEGDACRRDTARLRQERDQICAELRRQLASLGQLQEQGGSLVLTLASDILFDFDKYDLRPVARENLAKLTVVRQLLFPQAAVRYEGYTDLVGEEAYNQWLSEQRSLAVYRYFLEDRLARAQDDAARAQLAEHIKGVDELLKMTYAQTRRQPERRQQLLAPLGDTVIGKGMREPVVPEKRPNEKNRRVTLSFPEAPTGEVTALCPAPPSEP